MGQPWPVALRSPALGRFRSHLWGLWRGNLIKLCMPLQALSKIIPFMLLLTGIPAGESGDSTEPRETARFTQAARNRSLGDDSSQN